MQQISFWFYFLRFLSFFAIEIRPMNVERISFFVLTFQILHTTFRPADDH